MESRPYFFDLTPDALTEFVHSWGMPTFRAKQLLEWVYRKHVADPAQMTNLSKADRERIAAAIDFTSGRVVRQQAATDGVQKLLIQWDDRIERSRASKQTPPVELDPAAPAEGFSLALIDDPTRQTECVMIPNEDVSGSRRTACISSQVGCPVGCRFCASGLGGLDGNLTAGQIVEQAWRLGADERVTNVVFMGMGEPLANFEQVSAAVRTLMADWGLGISGRKITISTVGLPAQMRRLADLELPITLAISLHAPNDAIRRQIIPWAEFVTIPQLVDAGRYYFEKTGREITLEYILLHGVNDRPEHARELASVAKRLRSNVNLIRFNEVKDLPYLRPTDTDVRTFQATLREAGVNTHIRASRGRDIAAACGQLRHEHKAAV